MARLSLPSLRRFLALGFLAFYGAVDTVVPVAHASLAPTRTPDTHVEERGSTCPPVHDELACIVCAVGRTVATGTARVAFDVLAAEHDHPAPALVTACPAAPRTSNRSRAPPVA